MDLYDLKIYRYVYGNSPCDVCEGFVVVEKHGETQAEGNQ